MDKTLFLEYIKIDINDNDTIMDVDNNLTFIFPFVCR